MNNLLTISSLSKSFEGTILFNEIDLTVQSKSISLLTGDNGSGKSTLFNIISGFEKVDHGDIFLLGEKINNLAPLKIVKKGVARLFQTPRVFKNLTIKENIQISDKIERKFDYMDFLETVDLLKYYETNVGELSFGQQKLVSLCSIFTSEPKLLLLDEPLAGLDQNVIPYVKEMFVKLNETGLSCLIVEHNRSLIQDICHKEYILQGHKISELAIE